MKKIRIRSCILAFVAVSFLLLPLGAVAREVKGVSFPEEVMIGRTPCKLIGVGLRKRFLTEVYYGALYMQKSTRKPEWVVASDAPKRVVLHVVHKEVEPSEWVENWQEGFSRTAPNPDKVLKENIDVFLRCFRESVKKGEEVQISYQPQVGTEVVIKGKPCGSIPGKSFMEALWGTWFGKQPVSESLMSGMLGR